MTPYASLLSGIRCARRQARRLWVLAGTLDASRPGRGDYRRDERQDVRNLIRKKIRQARLAQEPRQ